MDLVGYSSSSDSEDVSTTSRRSCSEKDRARNGESKPAKRQRTLPPLADSFNSLIPVDDPSLHQGRQRSRPFVQGDWNAHIYLSLKPDHRLREVLEQIIQQANDDLSGDDGIEVHSLLSTPSGSPSAAPPTLALQDLHISLSHPLPLRRDQVSSLHDHLRRNLDAVPRNGPSRISLVDQIVSYQNGALAKSSRLSDGRKSAPSQEERGATTSAAEDGEDGFLAGLGRRGVGVAGRAFLALRVGAGHDKLASIQEKILTPFLKLHHLPLYHSNPEFHTSFAWCLLKREGNPFDADFLEKLNERMEVRLGNVMRKGGWEIGDMEVKVGKSVTRYRL